MIVLGITGSIAMGKSLVASQFASLGAASCNSDDIVHQLMAEGGEAVDSVGNAFPSAIKNGQIDRKKLGEIIFPDDDKRIMLEKILHPMVAEKEIEFLEQERQKETGLAVLDIPLLFEAGAEKRCDYVLVATAPRCVQAWRAMKRDGMTKEKFQCILSRQMPDTEKCQRADFIVQTGFGKAYSFYQVKKIMRKLHAA